MTTQSWLWLAFCCKMKKYIYIYSHSTKNICVQGIILHPATVYSAASRNSIYSTLSKCMLYVVNFQGNIFIQRTFIYSQKYSLIEIIFVQEIISIQGRKLSSFKEIYSLKETISIQQLCVPRHSRNIYSTSFPSDFIIIISFIITIS